MNDDLHTFIEPELQARITALVLGEASEFECDELEKLIAAKPELAIYRRRMQAMHDLLADAVKPEKDPAWQLSDDRREKLRHTFANHGQPAGTLKKRTTARTQWRTAIGIAACILVTVILFSMATPVLYKSGSKEQMTPEMVSYQAAASDDGIVRAAEEPTAQTETRSVERKPSAPSSSMSRVIASNSVRPSVEVPIPEAPVPDPTAGFGNGDDFGDGWGGGGGSDGDADPFGAPEKKKAVAENEDHGKKTTSDRVVRRELPKKPADGLAGKSKQVVVGYAGQEGKDLSGVATAGQRSGDYAVTRESIDAILNNPTRSDDRSFLSGGSVGGDEAPDNTLSGGLYDLAKDSSAGEKSPLRWSAGLSMGFDDNETAANFPATPATPTDVESRNTEEVRYSIDRNDAPATVSPGGVTSSIAEKEIARRASLVSEADKALLEGREAYANKDYKKAAKLYGKAKNLLPPGQAMSDRSRSIAGHLGDANVALAQQYRRVGKYEKARKALEETLLNDPSNFAAKKQLEYLDDPIRTNHALTGEHTKAVAEVRKGLYMGEGYYNLGKYDEAEAEMKKVLQKDPYNKAARRWLEKVSATKSDYYRAAYDHTRAELLAEVDRAWEMAVPPELDARPVAKPTPASRPVVETGKLGRIKSELQKKSDRVAETRRKLMDAAEKVGVVWVESERGGQTIGGELELRQLAEKQLYETERERDQLKSQIDKLLQNGKETTAQKKKREALVGRLSIIDGRVQKMREIRDKKQDQGTDKARAFQEFNKLRKEYETAQGIKDQLQIRYDVEKTKLGIPSNDLKVAPKKKLIPSPLQPKALPDETLTTEEPFSTFSLNVNDVSFKLARVALLEKGAWPDAAKVRTEEFVNAFDYGDPSPRRGEPVACAIEQSAHPFLQQRNLLRIGMKTAAMGRSQPLRLTVLLDNSGSMEREDREASVLAAMQVLAAQLGPQDVITVVGFARQPRLLADRVRGDQAGKLVGLIAKTPSEGGTNIEEALRLARTLAKRQHSDGAQSRVVLITDGVANLGNTVPAELSKEIETMRQQGIAFDACGVGAEGLNDDILEALTRKGDGRYYFLNRPEDADAGFAKQLAGALTPAAKNVKVQVVFNPKRVARYRLLGFEKHRLNKEDFRNDKVDAAEMAAEEAGNAVYQIQMNPQGEGELGEVFVRFLDASTGRMVERSWPLPYEPQAQPFDLTTPSMQLAGTAAMLGEKLHGTDAGSVRFSMISNTLGKIKAHYSADPKVNDLIRMCRKVE